MKFSTLLETK